MNHDDVEFRLFGFSGRPEVVKRRSTLGLEDMTDEQLQRAGLWKTKDGRMVHVSQMDEGHLANTIAMLERRDIKLRARAIYQAVSADLPFQELEEGMREAYLNFEQDAWIEVLETELLDR